MKNYSLIHRTLFLLFFLISIAPVEAHDTLKAYVGIWFQHIDEDKAAFMEVPDNNVNGILINGVGENSPAYTAGLNPMDYIYAINGRAFENSRNWSDEIKAFEPGETLELGVVRQRELISLSITLAEKSQKTDDEYDTGAFLGVNYRWKQNKQPKSGALVDVINGTSAEAMGLQNGDVIVEINDYRIYDWHDLGIVVDNTPVGNEFCVTYLRDGEEFKTCDLIRKRKSDDDQLEELMNEVAEILEEWITVVDQVDNNVTLIGKDEGMSSEMTKTLQNDQGQVWVGDMTEAETEMMEQSFSMEMPVNSIPFKDINLYPNPNRGKFTFYVELESTGDADLLITNAVGKQIYQERIANALGRIERDLDVSGNAKGVYFLIIIQNNQSITKRVIVN